MRHWPPPLRPGDLVAVVAPSGPVAEERLAAGMAVLESWGLRVRPAPHVRDRHERLPYLAGDDAMRAADLVGAWRDQSVAAVWAARGGYGVQRMVDGLDFARMRAAGQKVFVGFSDVTALHARIGRELGLVTLHGPNVTSLGSLADGPAGNALRALLFDGPSPGLRLLTGRGQGGVAEGRLVGGNLSLLAADVGVEPPPGDPAVAVLEDVHEPGYRVDRMLTQLLRGGWFASVTGVVVGDFADPSGRVAATLTDRLGGLDVPLLLDASVGHVPANVALPLGADVRLDAAAGTLSLL